VTTGAVGEGRSELGQWLAGNCDLDHFLLFSITFNSPSVATACSHVDFETSLSQELPSEDSFCRS